MAGRKGDRGEGSTVGMAFSVWFCDLLWTGVPAPWGGGGVPRHTAVEAQRQPLLAQLRACE